ncbi:hypothetical protein [Hafnia paralvei]|uniref:hypothetical protein n=1 Tax=Hafnia paralvei TaxID=546367 RepID=UPI002032A2E1|nr:hypothetical protein [Hafnia paralvei]
MSGVFVGFALFVSACGLDACEALPVSDDIYPTQQACQQMLEAIHERRPHVTLMCGEIYDDQE